MPCTRTRLAALAVFAALASGALAGASPSLPQRAGQAVERAGTATAHGVKRGVEATKHGVQVGVQATARGLSRAGEAVEHGTHKAAHWMRSTAGKLAS